MVRVVTGLARSGKTARVMNEIAGIVASAPREYSRRAVLIVPEQYSHNAERHLLTLCGDKMSLCAEVLSFTRLASRVYEELGMGYKVTGSAARLLNLYRAISECSPQLSVYGKLSVREEYLQRINYTLTELKNSGVTPEALMNASDKFGGSLSAKTRDLAILSSAADTLAKTAGTRDAPSLLKDVARYISETSFAGAKLYFDGFSDFTAPQLEIITALILADADITFCFTCGGSDDTDDAFDLVRDTLLHITDLCAVYGKPLSREHQSGGVTSARPAPTARIFCASDTLAETEYAASIALSLVKSGMRYRDIGVFSRSGQYSDSLARTFARYGLPAYCAERSGITSIAAVRALLAAVDLCLNPKTTDDVIAYARTGFSGISREECDVLENYAIINAVLPAQWTRDKAWAFAEDKDLNAQADTLRRTVLSPVSYLGRALGNAETCDKKTEALYEYLEAIGLADAIDARERQLRVTDIPLADTYAQLWDKIVSCLEDLHSSGSGLAVSNKEFSKLLLLALSQHDIGTIPASIDRITIGDFSRSRRRELRALIVVGASEEKMSAAAQPSGVLSYTEREAIAKAEIHIGDNAETAAARENYMIYSSLSLPSEYLYLIYAESENPSYQLEQFKDSYGIDFRKLPPEEYLASAETPYREYSASFSREKHNPLFLPPLSQRGVEALYGGTLTLSATAINERVQCSYKYFLNHGLRLSERKEIDVDGLEHGLLNHYLLEAVAKKAHDLGGFAEIDDEVIIKTVREAAERYFGEKLTAFDERSDRYKYLMRRISSNGEFLALTLAEEVRNSGFDPVKFESRFDLPISPDVNVIGYMDRIDTAVIAGREYARVSDYKSYSPEFKLADLYHGLGIQVFLYLKAITALGGTLPAAALYLTEKNVIASLSRGASDEEISTEIGDKLGSSGIVLNSYEVIEQLEHGNPKKRLPIKKEKSGEYIGKSGGSVVLPSQIDTLLRLTDRRINDTASAIRSGTASPFPYRYGKSTSCDYCPFCDACRFGVRAKDTPRFLRVLNEEDFWQKVRIETGGKGAPDNG